MTEHVLARRVEWGDCDPAAIVFYPNFYRWMDEATWAFLESRGLDHAALRARFDAFFGTPLVETGAQFLSPMRHGDHFVVRSSVAEWKRKTFKMAHRFVTKAETVAIGFEIRILGVRDREHPERLRAAPIPTDFRDTLS